MGNAANELTQATGGINRSYAYDGDGNLTSASNGLQLAYNAAEQTTSITPPGGTARSTTYTGEGEGERVTYGSTTAQYDATGLSSQTTSSGTSTLTTLPNGTPTGRGQRGQELLLSDRWRRSGGRGDR